jgi:hypothetical protein
MVKGFFVSPFLSPFPLGMQQMRLDKTRLAREESDLLGGESPGIQICNKLRPI